MSSQGDFDASLNSAVQPGVQWGGEGVEGVEGAGLCAATATKTFSTEKVSLKIYLSKTLEGIKGMSQVSVKGWRGHAPLKRAL